MSIRFYGMTKPNPKYWPFSNFYRESFRYNGVIWKTSEHAYQAMKSPIFAVQETIRLLKTPMEAAELGRSLSLIIEDWDLRKYGFMVDILYAKFSQNPNLKILLLETGDEEIIEDSPKDWIWGCGKDGKGQNLLGKALMEVRAKLMEEGL